MRFVRLLSEISKTLVDVLPLSQVLSRVVDLVFEVVPAERTFLLLRDNADEAVTARVLRARDGSTPDATLSRTVVNKVMREPDLRDKIAAEGAEPAPSTPQEFGKLISSELAVWQKVIKAAGL